jgi:hypothetical protein
MTVNTRVIKLILARTDLPYVELTAGLRLQVIPNIKDLPHCQKHQSAAFIATQQMLVVWEDDPKRLLERASYIQETLMKMIWGVTDVAPMDQDDLETADEKPRRTVLIQAWLTAATLVLAISALGGGWRNIAIEIVVDRNYVRLAFLACLLPQVWLSLVRTLRPMLFIIFHPSLYVNRHSSSSKPS